jgi:hypothetical protein
MTTFVATAFRVVVLVLEQVHVLLLAGGGGRGADALGIDEPIDALLQQIKPY